LLTRDPEVVATQLVTILNDPSLEAGRAYFYNKGGRLPADDHIQEAKRQADVLAVSPALVAKGGRSTLALSRPRDRRLQRGQRPCV